MPREDGQRRLRTLITALERKTVANGCTEAEARAASVKLAELQLRLDGLVAEAAAKAVAQEQEARAQAAREKAARQTAAREQAARAKAEQDRADLAEFERRAREQAARAARQAKEAAAGEPARQKARPAAAQTAPERENTTKPAAPAFSAAPGKVDVFATDEHVIVDAVHAAIRTLGPNFKIAGEMGGRYGDQVRAVVNRLLQAGELRDRDGQVLSSVIFQGDTLHRAAPPVAPLLGGLFTGKPLAS